MLFITSRTPKGKSPKSEKGRELAFELQNTDVSRYLYFCERDSQGKYKEVMSEALFSKLKQLETGVQLLFYIHGFNNNPEKDVFPKAQRLEHRLNEAGHGDIVKVIPIIWPCDDDSPLAFADDYWDDQKASKISGLAFSRLLGKFDNWRNKEEQLAIPCLKRMNILAHSMGNNVLQHALKEWSEDNNNQVPQLFRNIFMQAADVQNHTLEQGEIGDKIPESARNVVVYYANDDLAMPASKIANIKKLTLSRRLGMTGPETLSKVPKNVIEVDCDNFNNSIDKPKGHSYFIEDSDQNIVSPCIQHMADAIKTGRVTHKKQKLVLEKPDTL